MQKIKDFIIKHKVFLRQFVLYGIIGVTAAAIDTVSFYFLNKSLNVFVSNLISVNIGLSISFILNTFINFRMSDNILKRAGTFFLIGYVGLAISTGIIYVGVNLMNIHEMYVKVFAVLVAALFQFICNKLITYRSHDKPDEEQK